MSFKSASIRYWVPTLAATLLLGQVVFAEPVNKGKLLPLQRLQNLVRKQVALNRLI